MDPDVTPELLAERLAELLTPWEFSADEMLLPSAPAVLVLSDDDRRPGKLYLAVLGAHEASEEGGFEAVASTPEAGAKFRWFCRICGIQDLKWKLRVIGASIAIIKSFWINSTACDARGGFLVVWTPERSSRGFVPG